MMTDMLGGSVNQQFCPYVNDHRHLICGINLPCALSLVITASGYASYCRDHPDYCKKSPEAI